MEFEAFEIKYSFSDTDFIVTQICELMRMFLIKFTNISSKIKGETLSLHHPEFSIRVDISDQDKYLEKNPGFDT